MADVDAQSLVSASENLTDPEPAVSSRSTTPHGEHEVSDAGSVVPSATEPEGPAIDSVPADHTGAEAVGSSPMPANEAVNPSVAEPKEEKADPVKPVTATKKPVQPTGSKSNGHGGPTSPVVKRVGTNVFI